MKYNPYLQTIQGFERWASPAEKRFEKRRRHRKFRRLSRLALKREREECFYTYDYWTTQNISQHILVGGRYLM